MEAINYDELFDEWFENEALHEHVEAIFAVLEERFEDPVWLDQLAIEDFIFELLDDLSTQGDFAAVLRLQGLLKIKYPDVYENDFDYFADVLMLYYLRTGQRDEAKALWEEWIERDYDYILFSPSLNLLAYCGEVAWVAEYTGKVYNKRTKADYLSPFEEEYLVKYKLFIEMGKLDAGQQTADEVVDEMLLHQVITDERRKIVLEAMEKDMDCKVDIAAAVSPTLVAFREELISQYAMPFLTAQLILDTLQDYYRKRNFFKMASFFKIEEKKLERYIVHNNMGMMRADSEGSIAMLYALPVLFLFLENKGIFTAADRAKETKKVAVLKQRYENEYPKTAAVFDSLAMYQKMEAIT